MHNFQLLSALHYFVLDFYQVYLLFDGFQRGDVCALSSLSTRVKNLPPFGRRFLADFSMPLLYKENKIYTPFENISYPQRVFSLAVISSKSFFPNGGINIRSKIKYDSNYRQSFCIQYPIEIGDCLSHSVKPNDFSRFLLTQ